MALLKSFFLNFNNPHEPSTERRRDDLCLAYCRLRRFAQRAITRLSILSQSKRDVGKVVSTGLRSRINPLDWLCAAASLGVIGYIVYQGP